MKNAFLDRTRYKQVRVGVLTSHFAGLLENRSVLRKIPVQITLVYATLNRHISTAPVAKEGDFTIFT